MLSQMVHAWTINAVTALLCLGVLFMFVINGPARLFMHLEQIFVTGFLKAGELLVS